MVSFLNGTSEPSYRPIGRSENILYNAFLRPINNLTVANYLDVFHVVLNTKEIFGYSDSNLFAEYLFIR